ncbi:dephospho-CoA kinase [Alicyclobacillus acidoterrestris]|uniref:Dephospho-CoA kinase n=1 Tax=Alicyclobacillus acidoterrestris (strain ATCC 49025 / DSM 3922 / CIP 106132 / NCIMB 13137 / GD3B) TaxID=1356854 RepID=A0A9E7CRU9_ALIAG|nr:dephospho-CoA kinase [Alicyclobacillus acidoterrestris]UNO48550.1 dephospho-CoA kinase [Alicyclobacillus acidoterrestris]
MSVIVGLTGGIATGKSTVSDMLRELGAYVVDADVWARRVVEAGSDGLQEIRRVFGDAVLAPDGTLDRKALGRIVFTNAHLREQLNLITHPRIRQGMKKETADYLAKHPGEPVVWDVPLLFEGETRHLVDCTVVVYTPPDVQLARLMARDGLNESEARARISAQMPIDQKRALADYVIVNDSTLENTREQVQAVWTTIRSQANGAPSSLS